jgi:Tfp pilus assembly protein PilO
MGWGRYFFLGDLGQQLDLADHETEIENLKQQLQARQSTSASVQSRLQTLQEENDEIKLYLVSILRLLISKKVASAEEIRALVDVVDREDGSADQRYRGPMLP